MYILWKHPQHHKGRRQATSNTFPCRKRRLSLPPQSYNNPVRRIQCTACRCIRRRQRSRLARVPKTDCLNPLLQTQANSNSILSPGKRSDDPDTRIAPLIKRPIHIDYGENVHIHPSCFINRDCYIAHSPESVISIGENTIVGVGARLLGVTHPIDWRERHGRCGMSLAADVKIGKECFLGAGVTLLHV